MVDPNTSIAHDASERVSTAGASPFKKPRPLPLRLWHWLNALTILGLLATVLLRKTFLSWRTNSALIEARVTEHGSAISTDDAVALAKELREPMWEWHYVFGFALAAMLILRAFVAFRDRKQAPLRTAMEALTSFVRSRAKERRDRLHPLAVKLSYVVFYAFVTFMAASGLAMYYGDAIGLSPELHELLKEAHELFMWFFVVFLGAHIVGVVVAELRGARGIVSDMIHGGDPRQNRGPTRDGGENAPETR